MAGLTRAVASVGAAVLVLGGTVTALASGASATTAGEVVFADGFESGDLSAWTGGSGLTVGSAVVHEGSYAARATMSGSAAQAYRTLPAAQAELTASLAVDVLSLPSGSAVNFLKLRTSTGSAVAEVYVTSTGFLGVRNDVAAVSTNSTAVLGAGGWHDVSLHVVVDGTSSRIDLTLDGTTVLQQQATDLGTAPVGRVQVGENVSGRTADLAYDSVSAAVPAPEPPPGPPALFSDGFESGDLAAWTGGTGLTVQQSLVADGQWAARGTMTGGAAYAYRTLAAPVGDLTAQLAVRRLTQTGTAAVNFLKLRTSSGAAVLEAYVTTAGVLGLRNDVLGVSTNSTASLGDGAWHTVALRAAPAGAAGKAQLVLDGTTVLDLTTDLGTTPVGRVQVGENVAGRTADLVYDSAVVTDSTPVSADPVVLAAGDISCDPQNTAYKGGDGTATACKQKAVSDLVLAQKDVSVVAALGDIQYMCGGYDAFLTAYDPTWGRFRSITRPAVGNHEYLDAGEAGPNATDCDTTGTATGYFTYFGAAAGQPGQGYYGYDIGSWHVVVLNTNCSDAGGCGPGSPQETWLRADLAAHPVQCTLAYWHIPLWSSGGRAELNSKSLVKDLVAAGADVVLTGHDHIYERFAPMDAEGNASPSGVREFVVGTGGANHTSIVTAAPNSEVRDDTSFGVLRMTLHEGSYDWEFVPTAGGTFTDSGSATCH